MSKVPVIPDVAFLDNSEQRTPLVLVLDCSGSMNGPAITQLNEGLRLLEEELKGDAIACKRVRVLVVTFGGMDEACVAQDWEDAMDFTAPQLSANGSTPMGAAVEMALTAIEAEKAGFRQAGVPYTRPWMFLMSDGTPTDVWEDVAQRCRDAEQANKVAVFPVAVGNKVNATTLGEFSTRGASAVKTLNGLRFKELFLWLSASMKVVSQSTPGGKVQLPPVDSWSTAPV